MVSHLLSQHLRQVVKSSSHLDMFAPQFGLRDCKRTIVKRPSFVVLALGCHEHEGEILNIYA